MPRSNTPVLALVALSLIVVVAGCGKSKPAATSTQTSTTTTTSSTTPQTTTTTKTATSGLSGIATASNCVQLAGLGASLAQAITGTGNTDVHKTAALLQEFADRTPTAIRSDFQVVAAAYAKIAGALKGVNLGSGKAPSPSVIAKLSQLGAQINSPALQKADTDIQAWAQTNCGHG